MSKINEMYSRVPGLVLGFHGCPKEVFEEVIYADQRLKPSTNSYDWLGNGIYFWENSYERALEWAQTHYGDNGRVIGAVISLGLCLDLTDYASASILKEGYSMLEKLFKNAKAEMPKNSYGRSKSDVLLRHLDCAVIEQIHEFNRKNEQPMYDSVRGIFTEGDEMYKGAAFQEKTHIQLCITNPNCIKGYFKPLNAISGYSIP